MGQKYVYMVHVGRKAAFYLSKADAKKVAKREKGEIRYMPYNHYKGISWDFPTFYGASKPLAKSEYNPNTGHYEKKKKK